jgi:hypothetical protein
VRGSHDGRHAEAAAMLTVVTLQEIERIFSVLEEFGLSREAVVIPLKPAHPGTVRMRPDHRLEIVLDREVPIDAQLSTVRAAVAEILASSAGARLKRAE